MFLYVNLLIVNVFLNCLIIDCIFIDWCFTLNSCSGVQVFVSILVHAILETSIPLSVLDKTFTTSNSITTNGIKLLHKEMPQFTIDS